MANTNTKTVIPPEPAGICPPLTISTGGLGIAFESAFSHVPTAEKNASSDARHTTSQRGDELRAHGVHRGHPDGQQQRPGSSITRIALLRP